jgi:hypothetical protein
MTGKPYPPNGSRTPEAKARREEHWRGVLERWRASGLPKTDFSRRERISPDVLAWWQAEIHKRDVAKRRQSSASTAARVRWRTAPRPGGASQPPAFVPVRVVESTPPSAPPAPLEVLVAGRVVRVRAGFDAETLGRLLAALEGRAC